MQRRELLAGAMALALAGKASAGIAPARSEASPGPGRSPGWGPAYTRAELRDAERRFGLRFPPDLFAFLLQRRFPESPDWTKDDEDVRGLLGLPLEGLQFDIYANDYWAPFWGPRPASMDERFAIVERLVKAAPRLIPLSPSRYIPESPARAGNPILYVFLSDVRYYAANLAAYAEGLSSRTHRGPAAGERQLVPFWTEMSRIRGQPARRVR